MKKKVWESKWSSRFLQIYGFHTYVPVVVPPIRTVAVLLMIFIRSDSKSQTIIYILVDYRAFSLCNFAMMQETEEE